MAGLVRRALGAADQQATTRAAGVGKRMTKRRARGVRWTGSCDCATQDEVGAEGVGVIVRGSVTRGEAPTRTLLRAVWLVDLAVLLGLGAWAGAGLLVVAHVLARLAAGALFAPPRPAATIGE